MAVALSFRLDQSTNCKNLTFYETTGAYSVTNTTGWGAPNEATSDALTATLLITPPTGTATTLNLLSLGTYPKSDSTIGYTITPTALGLSSTSQLSDGIYTFKYTVTTALNTYTQTIQQALTCQVQCCVYSMLNSIDLTCSGCSDQQIKEFNKAYIILKGLVYSGGCGEISTFNKNIAILQKLCNQTNCQNCN